MASRLGGFLGVSLMLRRHTSHQRVTRPRPAEASCLIHCIITLFSFDARAPTRAMFLMGPMSRQVVVSLCDVPFRNSLGLSGTGNVPYSPGGRRDMSKGHAKCHPMSKTGDRAPQVTSQKCPPCVRPTSKANRLSEILNDISEFRPEIR